MGQSVPPKEDVAQALLLRGSIFVHLDPRASGVALPDYLSDQPQVMLQIGLDLPVPIPDLRVGSRGISGTLSFNREPFHCVIPWAAVFALSGDDGRGMVWEASLPVEVSDELEREMGRRPPVGLRVVEGWAQSEERREPRRVSRMPRDRVEADAGPRVLPPYLRVVK